MVQRLLVAAKSMLRTGSSCPYRNPPFSLQMRFRMARPRRAGEQCRYLRQSRLVFTGLLIFTGLFINVGGSPEAVSKLAKWFDRERRPMWARASARTHMESCEADIFSEYRESSTSSGENALRCRASLAVLTGNIQLPQDALTHYNAPQLQAKFERRERRPNDRLKASVRN